MKDNQRRQYDAAVTGKKALDDNTAAYLGNTPLINKKTALGTAIVNVETIEGQQSADTKGYTQTKGTAKKTMCTQAWVIAKPLSIFAKDTGNTVLQNEVDFEVSDLLFAPDATAIDRCTTIKNRAVTNQTALTTGGYQITALLTTALTTAISDFQGKKGEKGVAKSGSKAATGNLKDAVTTMVGLCDDVLDLSVTYAAITPPTFYNTIQDAFAIGTIGVRHRAMRVTCSDQVTHVRLGKVDVKIVELNLTVKSSKRGIADFSHLDVAEGNYTITGTLNGYNVFTLSNVAVFDNKQTTVSAVMVKQ